MFPVKKRVAMSAIVLASALLGQNAHAQPYGQWQSYFPSGYSYARQLPSNGVVYGRVGVRSGPNAGDMQLHHSDSSGNLCTAQSNVEMFEVKYCSMTNIATGVVSYDQFDVFTGTHPATSLTRYMNRPLTLGVQTQTKLYFDNNNNYVVDAGDTGYWVDCGTTGHPYAIHDIQSTPTIMQAWFKQDMAGNGSAYIRRLFWQGRVAQAGNVTNPNWGTSGATAQSVVLSEAFWCADDNGADCPISGVWQVGVGDTGTLSDGKSWPTGANVGYGSNVWHSLTSPFWQYNAWYPSAASDGSDRADPFAGC